ncbi:MAG TPA: thioredoxin-like domain-containing protein [Jatrophihabitantaceae bacterium]|nr:thioredoxin-like domain-containing protein [Jatrophihabitantaceae bacterium]
MTPVRVRAPELPAGGAWFNSATPRTLASLRGRFVLLDFWTFCCANCLHVLDELRPVEERFADVLSVIGVHSPKFAHERDPRAVGAAIERYAVDHAVINDPELRLWQQYAVKAWPTLVLIDPEGYVVAQAAGEGQADALAANIEQLIPHYEARGTLRRGADPVPGSAPPETTLRFPAKAIVLPASRTGRDRDTLLVADAGHHSLAELTTDGTELLRRIGDGSRGRADGPAATARFAEPNGLALLPPGIAPFDVVVADTANHVLRGVRLADGAVVATIDLPAGLADARTVTGAVPAVLSPWDVAWWPALNRLVVAAAGVHMLLSVDPVAGAVEILAGTTVEGLRDGPARDGWLAQPSGLAADGDRLWFADAETSALRWVDASGELHTAVGEGLFDFGHVDGPAATARFQHPLGVTVLPDGAVAILDTYNGAVRRYDPTARTVATLATGLAEPSGAVILDGRLLVVESAAHTLADVGTEPQAVDGAAQRTNRPVTELGPGAITLDVRFEPAPGRKLDEQWGPATQLTVSASPPELLLGGAGESVELQRTLTLAAAGAVPGGILHVTAQAASCDAEGEHPACYLARQDWGIPVRVVAGGPDRLELPLLG